MDVKEIINLSKNLIIKPQEELKVINTDKANTKDILKNFILPYFITILVASLIGKLIFTDYIFYNSFGYITISSISTLLIYIIVLYLTPIILKHLGNSFGANVSQVSAFKLIAYSFVPSYIVSIIVGLLPMLSVLGIAGLYSLYIFWIGFDIFLNPPKDKKLIFFILTLIIIFAEYFIIGSIVNILLVKMFLISNILS